MLHHCQTTRVKHANDVNVNVELKSWVQRNPEIFLFLFFSLTAKPQQYPLIAICTAGKTRSLTAQRGRQTEGSNQCFS